jgi:carbon-monoxide dehydrogenase large subunit
MRQRHESRSAESDSPTGSVDPEELTPGTFVGSDVQRREDAHLLTGETSYLDDIAYPGTVHLALVRSQYASADIKAVDASDALDRDGVLAVYTSEDLAAAGIDEGMATDSPDQGVAPWYPVMVQDRVRYQGQPVAAVVATDRYLAHDAVEDVVVEYDRHDAVTDLDRARDPGAPAVHEAAPDNVAFEWAVGDDDAVEAAFASADRTVDLQLLNNRLMPVAMATQAVVARYRSADDELVVDVGSQKPHGTRSTLARILGLPEQRIDVRVPDVGGAFGGKLRLYPGHVLAAWGAMQLERPVKWIGTRIGDSIDTSHSRHQHVEAEAALDEDGAITGVRATIHANVGGYLIPGGSGVPSNTGRMICGQYDVPAAHVQVTGVFTNTTPLAAYRGAGRPEAAYIIERLANVAAREVGQDPVAFRRRNMIPPERFPHETPTGYTYDSGDYEASLDRALELVGYDELRDRQARLRMEGRYLGIGLSCYADKGGGHSSDYESGLIRITPEGTVVAGTGTMDTGQGHETSYAQIVADELGVPYEDVEIVEGDTSKTAEGRGTGGSRSVPMAGNALRASAEKLAAKGRLVAAKRFDVDPDAVAFEDGTYCVRDAAGEQRAVHIQELADDAYAGTDSLGDVEPGLEETAFFAPEDRTFPFGTHLAVVEVDPESGEVDFERYVAVDDCGVQINPTLVEGQIVGGIAQGIGQALSETVAYDDSGTLITGTLQDYAVPTATDVPAIETDSTVTPSPRNPLGVKGVGESGTIGAPPAVVNAVVDALRPFGVDHLDMPLTSETIWQAIDEERG